MRRESKDDAPTMAGRSGSPDISARTDEGTVSAAADRILKLTRALEQCVRVAKMWHGDDAFDLYFNHSPEMRLIRDALGKMSEDS